MSRQKTRDLFAWLNQVIADKTLTDAAFKVAYIVAQHINKDGDAWPSTKRIAELCSLSQPGALKLGRMLADAGHLTIEPGKPGRGHSHRYRLILKHNGGNVFDPGKDNGETGKDNVETVKHNGGYMNYLEPSKNQEERAHARAAAPRSVAEMVLEKKGWEIKQANQLIDKIERSQNAALEAQERTLPDWERKLRRAERKKAQNPGSMMAALDFDIAKIEAEIALGVERLPDNPFNGTTIDHEPLAGLLTPSSSR